MPDSLVDRAFADDVPDADGLPADAPSEERAAVALSLAIRYGGIDGAHHKDWVIDQMVRALAGPDYETFVDRACDGEDGPETYTWEEGIAP